MVSPAAVSSEHLELKHIYGPVEPGNTCVARFKLSFVDEFPGDWTGSITTSQVRFLALFRPARIQGYGEV